MLETLTYLHVVSTSQQNWSLAFISHSWYTPYQILLENLGGGTESQLRPSQYNHQNLKHHSQRTLIL